MSDSALPTPLAHEALLAGRYRYVRELGHGALGRVFLAADTKARHALRAIKAVGPADATWLAAEFASLRQVAHPNVAKVYELLRVDDDSAQLFALPKNGAWLVEEFVDGRTADLVAAEMHADRIALSRWVARFASVVSAALSAVHARGLVHGDIKPTNVVLRESDATDLTALRLIDFGLSRPMGSSTRVGGTTGFLAPEAWLGECSAGTDLYALGVTLVHLLSRQLSSESQSDRSLASLQQAAPPIPAWVDERLARPIAALCAADRGKRPSSAREVATQFTAVAELLGDTPPDAVVISNDESGEELAARIGSLPRVASDSAVADLVGALAATSVVWVAGAKGAGRSRAIRDAVQVVQQKARELERVVPTYVVVDALPNEAASYPSVVHVNGPTDPLSARAFVDACAIGSIEVSVVIEAPTPTPRGEAEVRVNPLGEEELRLLYAAVFGDGPRPADAWVAQCIRASGGLAGSICAALQSACVQGIDASSAAVWAQPQLEPGEATLSDDEQKVVSSIAVSGGALSLAAATLVAGEQNAESVLKQLVASSTVRILSDGTLALSVARRNSVVGSMTARQRRGLAGALLEIVHDGPARAYLLAAAGNDALAQSEFLEAIGRAHANARAAEALLLARDANAFYASNDSLRFALCDLLRAAGQYEEAKSLSESAGTHELVWLHGEVLRLLGERAQLSAWLTLARLNNDATYNLHALKARSLFYNGKQKEAGELAANVASRSEASSRAKQRAAEVLALLAMRGGDLAGAQHYAESANQLAAASEDSGATSRACSLMTSVLLQMGHTGSAIRYAERAVKFADSAGETHALAVYEVNLGLALLEEGDLGRALSSLRAAAQKMTRIGRASEVGRALYNAANAAALCANDELAVVLSTRAQENAKRVGDDLLALFSVLVLSDIHAHAHRWSQARALLPRTVVGAAVAQIPWASRVALLAAHENDRPTLSRVRELLTAFASGELTPALAVERMLADAACARGLQTEKEALAILLHARDRHENAPFELRLRVALYGAELGEAAKDRKATTLFLADARALLDHAAHTLDEHGRAQLRACPAYQRALSARPAPTGITPRAETEDRWRQLTSLAKELAAEQSAHRLEEAVLRAALALTRAERAFLIGSDGQGRLSVVAHRDVGGKIGAASEYSNSIVTRVLTSGKPELSVDALTDTRFARSASAHALLLRSVAAVPVRLADDGLGALYVDDRLRPSAFNDEELALLRDLAELASLAFDSAAQRRKERVARRKLALAHERLTQLVATQGLELSSLRRLDSDSSVAAQIGIVCASEAMRSVLALASRVAVSDVAVLITGESGTGKELVARAIHAESTRRTRPFISENCGAIPEPLLESALFGHVRGAFTGADRVRAGLFEVADGGTLLLDEIAELSPAMQVKFLRVLQTGEVRALGSDRIRRVDVRMIAATHRDVDAMVANGSFREDLFYRLAVVTIRVPPLRERVEDIAPLVAHFIERYAKSRSVRIEPHALALLQQYKWPGNVRQLENEVQRALVLCREVIRAEHLSDNVRGTAAPTSNATLGLRAHTDALEKRMIREALAQCSNNQTRAAKVLGLSRFGLQKMMRRLGLDK
ncbi:MAG: sigma 54-interacting transcriptional regulator [Sandaracinaceae bacterium]|nr:sigma 54-interacting transcriptional regulator [Sandaracinaceae bacterium]